MDAIISDTPERALKILGEHEHLVAVEIFYGPGQPGPDLHVHREHADAFHVLEGTFRFQVGEETYDRGPGSFVLVPPGVPHKFSNPFDAGARLLNLHAPGSRFGDYLRAGRDKQDTSFFDQHPVAP